MTNLWTRELGRQRREEQRQANDKRFTRAFELTKRLVAIGDETGVTVADADWPAQADYDQTMDDAAGRGGY